MTKADATSMVATAAEIVGKIVGVEGDFRTPRPSTMDEDLGAIAGLKFATDEFPGAIVEVAIGMCPARRIIVGTIWILLLPKGHVAKFSLGLKKSRAMMRPAC